MTKKTAMFIGFLLSTSSIIVILVFLFFRDKEMLKPMLYIGIGLGAASLILRNLLRFKPDLFKDSDIEEKK